MLSLCHSSVCHLCVTLCIVDKQYYVIGVGDGTDG